MALAPLLLLQAGGDHIILHNSAPCGFKIFHYRQQRVWKALQKSSQFVEVPLSFDESNHSNIAASVKVGSICAEVHNGADEATLAALFRVLKSC